MKVAILHYAAPPCIGGVEQTIYYQARYLADAGHAVRVIAGNGGQFDERVETVTLPEAGSRHEDVMRVAEGSGGWASITAVPGTLCFAEECSIRRPGGY